MSLGSQWNPPLGDSFEEIIRSVAEKDGQRIDFGCSIEGGAFNVTYPKDQDLVIETCRPELSLVTFIWQLVARLQAQGTAPAIEVPEYFKALDVTSV